MTARQAYVKEGIPDYFGQTNNDTQLCTHAELCSDWLLILKEVIAWSTLLEIQSFSLRTGERKYSEYVAQLEAVT